MNKSTAAIAVTAALPAYATKDKMFSHAAKAASFPNSFRASSPPWPFNNAFGLKSERDYAPIFIAAGPTPRMLCQNACSAQQHTGRRFRTVMNT